MCCTRSRTAILWRCIRTFGRSPDHHGAALVHLFRFEGDRIAELWDIGLPVPAESVNTNARF
jgi:predicted SnoaL-like aldol condensation-catalyzing enzyme